MIEKVTSLLTGYLTIQPVGCPPMFKLYISLYGIVHLSNVHLCTVHVRYTHSMHSDSLYLSLYYLYLCYVLTWSTSLCTPFRYSVYNSLFTVHLSSPHLYKVHRCTVYSHLITLLYLLLIPELRHRIINDMPLFFSGTYPFFKNMHSSRFWSKRTVLIATNNWLPRYSPVAPILVILSLSVNTCPFR